MILVLGLLVWFIRHIDLDEALFIALEFYFKIFNYRSTYYHLPDWSSPMEVYITPYLIGAAKRKSISSYLIGAAPLVVFGIQLWLQWHSGW